MTLSAPPMIRSYALRRGRKSCGKSRVLERLYPRYGLDSHCAAPHWPEVFHGCERLVVEIGSGSGEAVIAQAQRFPDCAFLAFEVYPAGVATLLRQIEAQQLDNVRVIAADVRTVWSRWFTLGQLEGISLFFPDPWPKNRHRKRRLCNRSFLVQAHALLSTAGMFHFATDWHDYYLTVCQLLEDSPGWKVLAAGADGTARRSRSVTRYERKAVAAGRAVWDVCASPTGR